MKILMFGWEFSPRHTGGLGIVCQELCLELSKKHEVTFILPSDLEETPSEKIEDTAVQPVLKNAAMVKEEELVEVIRNQEISYLGFDTNFTPYVPSEQLKAITKKEISAETREVEILKAVPLTGKYGKNLTAEVVKYTLSASELYQKDDFDIIHAHDWIGLNAGILAKSLLKIPLIAHVHSIEYDRNGLFGNPEILRAEKEGLAKADAIICVSSKTQKDLIDHYQIKKEKTFVIPNATKWRLNTKDQTSQNGFEVGFLGRFTHQKGPEKFVDLARELRNHSDDFNFTMMGEGYLENSLREKVSKQNLDKSFNFTGFLEPNKVKVKLKKMSLLVIPSISEPFGLVALEATAVGIPVIITENAGITEYIPYHTFKYWDTHAMKELVLELKEDQEATKQYVKDCQKALSNLSWSKSAKKVIDLYSKTTKSSR